jgi:Cof subfamily protein (haloacid dehalogenase superfamily)
MHQTPRFQLAAIDLDETLLGRDHRVSPLNARAVRALADSGIVCVIASGRMHESTMQFAEELGLDAPIISYHGALVKHARTGEVWHHAPLPADAAAELIRFCADSGRHLNYYLNDIVYVSQVGEWAEFYLRQTSSPMKAIGDLTALSGTEPTKLILIDTPEETDRLMPVFRERFGASVSVLKTNPEYLEFMNPTANKGTALAFVADRLGAAQEAVIAFGDGANDVEMIRWAGRGVAMGTAKQAVQDAADYIAPPFHEDGFALAVADIFGFDLTGD